MKGICNRRTCLNSKVAFNRRPVERKNETKNTAKSVSLSLPTRIPIDYLLPTKHYRITATIFLLLEIRVLTFRRGEIEVNVGDKGTSLKISRKYEILASYNFQR